MLSFFKTKYSTYAPYENYLYEKGNRKDLHCSLSENIIPYKENTPRYDIYTKEKSSIIPSLFLKYVFFAFDMYTKATIATIIKNLNVVDKQDNTVLNYYTNLKMLNYCTTKEKLYTCIRNMRKSDYLKRIIKKYPQIMLKTIPSGNITFVSIFINDNNISIDFGHSIEKILNHYAGNFYIKCPFTRNHLWFATQSQLADTLDIHKKNGWKGKAKLVCKNLAIDIDNLNNSTTINYSIRLDIETKKTQLNDTEAKEIIKTITKKKLQKH